LSAVVGNSRYFLQQPPWLRRYINAKFYYLGAQILLEAFAMKFDLKTVVTIDLAKVIYALSALMIAANECGLL